MKRKILYLFIGIVFFVAMFIFQGAASAIGGIVANKFYYRNIDPNNLFARIFVHHVVQMLIALFIIVILAYIFKKDFGFKLGNKKTGLKHVLIFSIIILIFTILKNIYDYSTIDNIRYSFPLNARNVIGTLSFQLFMSGPSEEILFRALPITLFIIIIRKSVKIKWGISLEVVLAALLFAAAHIDENLKIDFQIYYSFILGLAYGVTFQKTRSVIYPMLMHSLSNVIAVGIGYIFYILF